MFHVIAIVPRFSVNQGDPRQMVIVLYGELLFMVGSQGKRASGMKANMLQAIVNCLVINTASSAELLYGTGF